LQPRENKPTTKKKKEDSRVKESKTYFRISSGCNRTGYFSSEHPGRGNPVLVYDRDHE